MSNRKYTKNRDKIKKIICADIGKNTQDAVCIMSRLVIKMKQ